MAGKRNVVQSWLESWLEVLARVLARILAWYVGFLVKMTFPQNKRCDSICRQHSVTFKLKNRHCRASEKIHEYQIYSLAVVR